MCAVTSIVAATTHKRVRLAPREIPDDGECLVGLAPESRFDVADGRALPYGDASFDKAFTVNTVYFWSDPTRGCSEILRVLQEKPAEHMLTQGNYGNLLSFMQIGG